MANAINGTLTVRGPRKSIERFLEIEDAQAYLQFRVYAWSLYSPPVATGDRDEDLVRTKIRFSFRSSVPVQIARLCRDYEACRWSFDFNFEYRLEDWAPCQPEAHGHHDPYVHMESGEGNAYGGKDCHLSGIVPELKDHPGLARLTGQEPLHGTITMFAGQYEERLIVYGVEPIEATRACPLAELTASRSFWLDDTSLT